MFLKSKKYIMGLAVLAVAVVQVFGVPAGYLCGCTGNRSAQAKCESAACHPDQSKQDALAPNQARKATAHQSGGGNSQNEPNCKHSAIREGLTVTASPPVLELAMAVFFDLPPAFQLPDFTALMASFSEVERTEPPEYGSPPMPQLVARTIVLLV